MRPLKSILAFATLVALCAAGCGGSGDTSVGVGASSQVTVTPGASYNGSPDVFKGGLTTSTTTGGNTVVTLTQGSRTLALTLPGTSLSVGDSFRIGLDGALAAYTEVKTRDTDVYTWAAISGRITVTDTTSGSTAGLQLDNLKLQAAVIVEGNLAAGSLTMNGKVAGVKISGGGGIGGTANLSFSGQTETNADTSALSNPTIAYAEANGVGSLVAKAGSGDAQRIVGVVLSADATSGTTVTFGQDLTLGQVTFTQGTGTNAKIWTASSGSMNIVSRTGTRAKVQFINAKFTNPAPDTNTSTGSFVLNGTISRQ